MCLQTFFLKNFELPIPAHSVSFKNCIFNLLCPVFRCTAKQSNGETSHKGTWFSWLKGSREYVEKVRDSKKIGLLITFSKCCF